MTATSSAKWPWLLGLGACPTHLCAPGCGHRYLSWRDQNAWQYPPRPSPPAWISSAASMAASISSSLACGCTLFRRRNHQSDFAFDRRTRRKNCREPPCAVPRNTSSCSLVSSRDTATRAVVQDARHIGQRIDNPVRAFKGDQCCLHTHEFGEQLSCARRTWREGNQGKRSGPWASLKAPAP